MTILFALALNGVNSDYRNPYKQNPYQRHPQIHPSWDHPRRHPNRGRTFGVLKTKYHSEYQSEINKCISEICVFKIIFHQIQGRIPAITTEVIELHY